MKRSRSLIWLTPSLVMVAGLGLGIALAGRTEAPSVLAPPPLGLPPMYVPVENPITPEKVKLGRLLFMDRRLSRNNTLSCAMCHVPEQGFTSHELGAAIGVEGRSHRRNAPTIFNVGYQRSFFHDGREPHLEDQVWGPLLARNEMDMPAIGYVVEKVRQLPEYKGLFEAAFNAPVNSERIGQALASYQRTLASANSRFDRWHYGKEKNALNAEEQRGFHIFKGKGNCISCHSVGEKSALFTDHKFHNTGLGWERSMFPDRQTYRVQLAPGVFVDVKAHHLEAFEPPMSDVGRYEVTMNPKDRWAYKTPMLRNIALTSPYMHDGSLRTLEEVVDFYDKGGIDNPDKTPLVVRLNLTASEKTALVAFLKTLTGDNVATLTKEARQTPVDLPAQPMDASDTFLESLDKVRR